jgi:hypothetical protein
MFENKITELNEARDFLSNLVKECKTNGTKECPILRTFKNN